MGKKVPNFFSFVIEKYSNYEQVITDLNLFLNSDWNACLRFFSDFCIIFVRSLTHAIKVVQVGEEVCDILIISRFLENVNNEFGSDETKF